VTPDPSDDLEDIRQLRDKALEVRFEDALVAEYHRNSIGIGWTDLAGGTETMTPLVDTFRVEVLGLQRITSGIAGLISSGVQRAATQMDAALQNPHAARTPASNRQLEAEVIQEGAAGNSLIFRVPAVFEPSDDDGIQLGPHPGRASYALRALLNVLPENAEDFASFVRRVERAPQMERQAIQTISSLALGTPNGVALDLSSGPRYVRSTLDTGSASEVDEFLQDRKLRRSTESVSGLLDGFRGTRRVFYLITDDGREIAGSVDDTLLADVRRLAGRRVDASLAATRWVARNGSLGPQHYELVSIQPEVERPGLFP
jgi:hypothetical protein